MEAKDFQKKTALRVYKLFKEEKQNHVLIADEVGLGKTIVAQEVVRLVSSWHKKEGNQHFKVLYICSNANIAKQNYQKLSSRRDSTTVDIVSKRLSMQHFDIYQRKMNHTYEEIIPMTPITSFNLSQRANRGASVERALCYAVLKECELFPATPYNLKKLLQVHDGLKSWDAITQEKLNDVRELGSEYIHHMAKQLNSYLNKGKGRQLCRDIEEICGRASFYSNTSYTERKGISNRIRRMFAEISLKMLKPDLVIMDEFQRFRDLIEGEKHKDEDDDYNEDEVINAKFLHDDTVKVLLLSATPYKPYTTMEELSEGAATHEDDFRQLMRFLLEDNEKHQRFEEAWDNYSNKIVEIKTERFNALITAKRRAESELYNGVCRTERLSNDMIDTTKAREYPEFFDENDILSFVEAQTLMSQYLYGGFPVGYAKSAPYLFSFMNNYKVNRDIMGEHEKHESVSLSRFPELFLSRDTIQRYSEIPCNNMRLRVLYDECFGGDRGNRGHKRNSAELLLWIPASRPYYRHDLPNNPFSAEENKGYSKILVFSAWEMVPRMIAGLTSYEAERLTIGRINKRHKKGKKKRYFAGEGQTKRRVTRLLRGAAEEILTVPSPFLSELFNPLDFFDKSLDSIIAKVGRAIQKKVDKIRTEFELEKNNRAGAEQLIELIHALDGEATGGLRKIDYPKCIENLAYIAVASPANVLYRVFCNSGCSQEDAIKYAEEIASGFVQIFNREDAMAIMDVIFRNNKPKYHYEKAMRYCAWGNLQAVMDEYAFTLGSKGADLFEDMQNIFLRTAPTEIETIESVQGKCDKSRLRMHFAVGYYNAKVDSDSVQRTEHIRKAFNSPFRPFVLASTSIGQEGLDFHTYCRKIMHWNLPHNPIDLEQREGRINRYMCLAIRQNLAEWTRDRGLEFSKAESVWDSIMREAVKVWKKDHSDLVPYWTLPKTFPFNRYKRPIERIVPMYPHSTDRIRYEKIKGILALYRLTLGQPRQDELMETIKNENLKPDDIDELSINLSPYKRAHSVL